LVVTSIIYRKMTRMSQTLWNVDHRAIRLF